MAQLPEQIERSLLPGAARAGGKVIADEAKDQSRSADVAAAVQVKVKRGSDHVVAFVGIDPKYKNGWAASVGVWLEYGTDPHFITVDDSQREGMTASRINRLEREKGTLVINGKPVGRTVHHPGAQAHPFMRPSLDLKAGDAVKAAQAYIDRRVSRAGIAPELGEPEA